MPLHVDSLSRRRFLQISAAVGVATFARVGHAAEVAGDPNTFALLADIHIPSSRETAARGVNMAENFDRVRAEIVALKQPPAAVLIDGDCAYLEGKAEDYALLSD